MNKIMSKIAISTAAVALTIGGTVAAAAPAQADSNDIYFVKTVTQSAVLELDFETYEFVCDWFQYDRRNMYQDSWREVWAGEGISYNDMRRGIYRAMKNVC
jgi:hypothetical protein